MISLLCPVRRLPTMPTLMPGRIRNQTSTADQNRWIMRAQFLAPAWLPKSVERARVFAVKSLVFVMDSDLLLSFKTCLQEPSVSVSVFVLIGIRRGQACLLNSAESRVAVDCD